MAKELDLSKVTVSVGTLAEWLGVTEKRVQQLADDGIVRRKARGLYALEESVKGYNAFRAERSPGRSRSDDVDAAEYEKHRAAYTKYKAEEKRLQLELLQGKVHNADTVSAIMNEILANLRSKLLALPTITAPIVADLSDPNACQEAITTAVHDALTEIATYPKDEIAARQLRREYEAAAISMEDDDA